MKKDTASDIVYEYVKNQIATRQLYPGNRLGEEELARATGISRTGIRSALLRLKYEGLVEQVPYRGAFIATPSEEDLFYVCQTRTLLELDAFRMAVSRRSEESLQEMEEVLKWQAEVEENFRMTDYAEVNHQFHSIIAAESGNPYYEKYLNELQNKIDTYLLFLDRSVRGANSLETHRRIYEALRDRDVEKGIAALKQDMGLFEDGVYPENKE